MADDVPPTPDTSDGDALIADPICQEARKFLNRCNEWEAVWRTRFLEDSKFSVGDSDNAYQWPGEIYNSRNRRAKPCLTINLIRQHNGIISNTARKNKSTAKFIGLGNGATQKSANVFRDMWCHVEWQSMAQEVYTIGRDWQVRGGRGYIRLGTEYTEGSVDEQEIYILPVIDPLSVFFDPDCKQKSGLDAAKALVFDDVPKEEFREAYPELRHVNLGQQPLGLGTTYSDWVGDQKIRVCEYFRKVKKERELMSFVHRGQRLTMDREKMESVLETEKHRKRVISDPQTRFRSEMLDEVEWYLIVGTDVVEKTIWPGRYIPLIPIRGEEIVVDGVWDSPGHTRHMKDAQRMFNYNASGQIEFVAGQTKTPWLVAKKAIEEFETDWAQANNETKSVLVYNHIDPTGGNDEPVPAPQRIDPPASSPAYGEGMNTALQQIQLASGQHPNEMGQPGNERTGAAIDGRKEQSDIATYQWQDNYETALVSVAKQFIDLAPKVYDTKRIKNIFADDGSDYELVIDPGYQKAFFEQQSEDGKVIRRILNLNVGKYDVAATVGPDFGSKRRETLQALTLILSANPGLMGLLGDYWVRMMDFEDADEAALRLKRMVPPQALGEGPTAKEQQLMAQLTALGLAAKKIIDANAKDKLKLVGKDQLRDIEAYKAETDRFKALADQLPTDPEGLRAVIEQLVGDSLKTNLKDVTESAQAETEQDNPEPEPDPNHPSSVPGAFQGGDSEWYLADPTRKGKYLHIAPLAQEHKRPGIVAGGG